MTKKNIRPQQVAPVERETISTAKDQSGQVTALILSESPTFLQILLNQHPFAGDDAE
ncbi:MAG: anacyclamide/piricyclamide family prenylated cyclic peptide [Nostocales cyanobacterium ELA583]|jgi:prenylated cyclic peptide (anacyclamide/piricyclamide family)